MKKNKRVNSPFLAIFGVPFFIIGVGFLLFSLIPSLYDGWRMATWPEGRATLTHARLISSTSDGSTTYGVEASYTYRVGGQEYRGERVAISGGSDNIGDYQQQLGRRLERHFQSQQLVAVYYNPNDPAEAVLDRTLRWGLLGFKLIFVVVFGGAGLGMILFGLRGRRVIDTPEAMNKPWLASPDWADNQIRSGAKGGLYVIWGFAVFWNLLSSPALFGFFEIREKEGAVAYLILLFPAVGLLLLSWAIKRGREWRRFGYTPLTLDPFPGAIGGDVGGEVTLNIPFQPQVVCEVTLSSIYSYVSGSGKNRSRHERVEWQDSGYARVERAARGMKLQFRFTVPEGGHESEAHSSSYYLWRLSLSAELPGVDLERDFEIPVYATGEHSHYIKVDSAHERPQGVPSLRAEALLPLRRRGMTTELYYPMLRHALPSLLGVIFGAVFAGVGGFLWGQAAREGVPLYFMALVFGAVGSLIMLGALYSAFNALRIVFDGRKITVTRSLLGMAISTREAAYNEVKSVEVKRGSMTTQQGQRHRIYYKVFACTPQGELPLAVQLDSHSKAKLVATFFRKRLHLPEAAD